VPSARHSGTRPRNRQVPVSCSPESAGTCEGERRIRAGLEPATPRITTGRSSRQASPVILLDGAYSTRPELADLIDVSVLLELPDPVRRTRLLTREGTAFMTRWHATWDHAEDHYVTHIRPPRTFDIVIGQHLQ
jgi:hypothetical protein